MLAFGFTNPLLADEDGVLITVHCRLEAAVALGNAEVLGTLGLSHREGEWHPYWSGWLD
jgi:hypothetical protein